MQDDPLDRSSIPESGENAQLFGTDGAAPPPSSPYRVLARKYRPASFDDLIGQEAMVRTLSNAFDLGRIHQAYILTGVRGVGKTTTARILARAFNYELPAKDGRAAVTGPTIHMPELGIHCQAIIESRHVDVIEMDAASHTGIDDVREIIENAQYRPMVARTKVYIIDEVHMLSKQAFNGLLKTLEEPPDHVKFLFATTEIEKVPVTVRSRCQRFDLRRIDTNVLIDHLASICAKEKVTIEAEALAEIARAAEGSVRDALSLLDQAIAHGGGGGAEVTGEAVRAMLGFADHGRIIDLFEAVMKGRMAAALAMIKDLYDGGADPAQVLVDLADFVHLVTRLKLVPEAAQDSSITPEERSRGRSFAEALSIPVLTRAWQLLVKGLQDVRDSPRPLAAADMVLVRLAHAADLPTPEEALRRLEETDKASRGEPRSGPGPIPGAPAPMAISAAVARAAQPLAGAVTGSAPRLETFEAIVALAGDKRDPLLKRALERDVRLVRFEPGRIEFSLVEGGSRTVAQDLMRRLQEWTGERWMVVVSTEPGGSTLKEREDAAARDSLPDLCADPLVAKVLAAFPGAEIVAVRPAKPVEPEGSAGAGAEPGDDDIGFIDEGPTDFDL